MFYTIGVHVREISGHAKSKGVPVSIVQAGNFIAIYFAVSYLFAIGAVDAADLTLAGYKLAVFILECMQFPLVEKAIGNILARIGSCQICLRYGLHVSGLNLAVVLYYFYELAVLFALLALPLVGVLGLSCGDELAVVLVFGISSIEQCCNCRCVVALNLARLLVQVEIIKRRGICVVFRDIAAAVNELCLAAGSALDIAVAGIGAGGLYNDGKVSYIVGVHCAAHVNDERGFVALNIYARAALGAVGDLEARLLAGSCLKHVNAALVVSACSADAVSICKRSDNESFDYGIGLLIVVSCAGVAIGEFDAGLLLSRIGSDVEDLYVMTSMNISNLVTRCQRGSRNQRCDHENSHQHAQQSLFHFLLFTSV